MSVADVEAPPAEAAASIPDYLASPNAVLADKDTQWRYGRAPDYTKTRKVFEESMFILPSRNLPASPISINLMPSQGP